MRNHHQCIVPHVHTGVRQSCIHATCPWLNAVGEAKREIAQSNHNRSTYDGAALPLEYGEQQWQKRLADDGAGAHVAAHRQSGGLPQQRLGMLLLLIGDQERQQGEEFAQQILHDKLLLDDVVENALVVSICRSRRAHLFLHRIHLSFIFFERSRFGFGFCEFLFVLCCRILPAVALLLLWWYRPCFAAAAIVVSWEFLRCGSNELCKHERTQGSLA
mmetsp:Transcript_5416/g.8831  ORF Transcript_5416/g.8831 Transcript_5416/m.8831 type:complete len:217 (-) Transcript_5416:2454-3104(-)